jgi:hypothetical protein
VINFPKTEAIEARARALRVPLPVIVRDHARIVEILNLRNPYTPAQVIRIVREQYVPLLEP